MMPRRLLSYNLLTAIVLFVVGYAVGVWIGDRVVSFGYVEDTSQNNVALVFGYAGAMIGWLVGLGFHAYPIRRMLGHPPSLRERESGGAGRYWRMCTDHKVVGLQYLAAILVFFFIGGLNAMLIRTELLRPSPPVFNPGAYLTLVGLHGTMMLMMMSAAILGPFGNYFVPLMIGAQRMAFPRIEALTFWLTPPAGIILMTAIFYGGFPTGWTGYAPLSTQGMEGIISYAVAFTLIGLSMVLTGINMIATVLTQRAPGMTWTRLPIFVWGVLSTSVLMVLGAPMLVTALMMLVMDRTLTTSFFSAPLGGSPYLFENMWWFFGHPEVYILALPGMAVVLELLPVFCRKPLWGYNLAVAGMLGVTLLSFVVWQHHLFVSGMNASLRPFYMLTTELISLPTGFIFLIGMGTLWRARIQLTVPMLFALAWFFNFLIGGLSGIYLSDVPSDVSTHGSYVVMAHFHYTIMGGLVFAFFAAIYYWLPKMTGVELNERLARVHFWGMFIFFNSTFLPLFALGAMGMPRRVVTYAHHLQPLNDFVSVSAFLLGASMLVFLVNIVYSLVLARVPAAANPWRSRALEWQLPTPVPVMNFETDPGDHRRALRLRRPRGAAGRRPRRRSRPGGRRLSHERPRREPLSRAARPGGAEPVGGRAPVGGGRRLLLRRVRVRVLLPARARLERHVPRPARPPVDGSRHGRPRGDRGVRGHGPLRRRPAAVGRRRRLEARGGDRARPRGRGHRPPDRPVRPVRTRSPGLSGLREHLPRVDDRVRDPPGRRRRLARGALRPVGSRARPPRRRLDRPAVGGGLRRLLGVHGGRGSDHVRAPLPRVTL